MKNALCAMVVLLAPILPAAPAGAEPICREARFEPVTLPDRSFVDPGRHLVCLDMDVANARVAGEHYSTFHLHALVVYGYTSSHSKGAVSAAALDLATRTEACAIPDEGEAECVVFEPRPRALLP